MHGRSLSTFKGILQDRELLALDHEANIPHSVSKTAPKIEISTLPIHSTHILPCRVGSHGDWDFCPVVSEGVRVREFKERGKEAGGRVGSDLGRARASRGGRLGWQRVAKTFVNGGTEEASSMVTTETRAIGVCKSSVLANDTTIVVDNRTLAEEMRSSAHEATSTRR